MGGFGPYSGDTNTCAEGGSLSALVSGEAPQQAYQGPEWVFTAPAGSTIAGGSLDASLTSPHGQVWLGTPNSTYDSADVIANCQYNLACGPDGTYTGVFPISHPGGTNLYAAAVCVGPYEGATTCPAVGGVDAQVDVTRAEIELSNSTTPAASAVTGTLLSPDASGVAELTFDASDPGGPGVYSVSVLIDGTAVYSGTPDTNGGECAAIGDSGGVLMFDHSQPCKQSESVDLAVNTAKLANGQHTLKVTVEDAAQNRSTVYDATITTENAPPNNSLGGPPGPGNNGGGGSGSGGGGGSTFTAAVANGMGASENARLQVGQRHRIVRSFAHGALRLAGRLLNDQGHPISGATLDILQQVAGSTQTTVIGQAGTGPTGTFTASVPAGPSRRLTLAYRAFSTDISYTTETSVDEIVRAGVRLKITPRATGSTGTILLEGEVDGPVPAQGVIVEMLVHYRGRWVTFRTPQTGPHGHFKTVYQFEGGIGRFPFRARIPGGQAGFPFTAGLSKIVDVATR
jgi:hypothetical protein